MSAHVHELLLTSLSNSNSSNRALFLFVQTPFDVAKQSVLRAYTCAARVCWSAIKSKKLLNDVAVCNIILYF